LGAQTGPAVLPSAQIIVGLLGPGDGHFSGGHIPAGGGLHEQVGQPFASSTFPYWQAMAHTGPQTGAFTQAQTDGELSNLLFASHATFWTHEQTPPQSAPPRAGSQLSLGSSTHLPKPGQALPVMPPHEGPVGTHLPALHCVPGAHRTAEQGSGLHEQVGQPFASSTFPYGQAILQTGGQTGMTETHAQTDGGPSNLVSAGQLTALCSHEQMPPQSAPPRVGSQLSRGSSTHLPRPGHALPAMPPHEGPSATHLPASQCVPDAHFTVAHGSIGAGLHLHVGQPFASSTLPYWQ